VIGNHQERWKEGYVKHNRETWFDVTQIASDDPIRNVFDKIDPQEMICLDKEPHSKISTSKHSKQKMG